MSTAIIQDSLRTEGPAQPQASEDGHDNAALLLSNHDSAYSSKLPSRTNSKPTALAPYKAFDVNRLSQSLEKVNLDSAYAETNHQRYSLVDFEEISATQIRRVGNRKVQERRALERREHDYAVERLFADDGTPERLFADDKIHNSERRLPDEGFVADKGTVERTHEMEELAKNQANSEVLNSIVKEHQRLIVHGPSNDHSGEIRKVEDGSDYRNSSTVSDDGSFEILDFETEAGVKTCAPGKKRKTSADGPGFATSGKTSDFSNESPGGDEGERDSDEYPSRRGGDGNNSGQHWHPREPDSLPKRFACPYYKNDQRSFQKCAAWSSPDLHRMKAHVLRKHLLPQQCPRCGHRCGEVGQVFSHLRKTDCPKSTYSPVPASIVKKGKNLSRKTWKQVYILLFDCNVREVPDPYIDVNDAFCDESDDGRTSADQSLEDIAPNSMETPPQPTTNAQEFGEFAGERLALKLRLAIEQLFAEFHGRSEASGIVTYHTPCSGVANARFPSSDLGETTGNNAEITSLSVSFPHSISPPVDASEYKQKPNQPTEPNSKLELLNARASAIDVRTESHHVPRDDKDLEISPDSVDSWFYSEIMNPEFGDLDFCF